MLIATLPTLVSERDCDLAKAIFAHPLVGGARYNTGGDSPFAPRRILEQLQLVAEQYNKPLYVDLEGRQMRVAEWTPFERGCVVLNRDFSIQLPGKIFFRRAGWCEITNVDEKSRKIYFEPLYSRANYFLGKTQSVHIVARQFAVKGYLGGLDLDYIKASRGLGVSRFMLSFVEESADIEEFFRTYWSLNGSSLKNPELVFKIESGKGMEFAKGFHRVSGIRLMAARDDLFLSFVDHRHEFLQALRQIVAKDANAIVASKIMSGVEQGGEMMLGDLTDLALMHAFGYQHFMLADELSRQFPTAMQQWQDIAVPILEQGV